MAAAIDLAWNRIRSPGGGAGVIRLAHHASADADGNRKYGLTNPNAAVFRRLLSTVAIGEPVYVDAMVNATIAPSNIVGVTWSLTSNMPAGSKAAFLPVVSWHQCAALQYVGSLHG
jgi:hypothetical protein